MVSKVLIVCEGSDDVGILNLYIKKHLYYPKDSFQIEPMGGKSFLLDAKCPNYVRIKSLLETGQYSRALFILDSDFEEHDAHSGGYENSEEKVKVLICDLGLADVASYFICCDPATTNGNLEHLLLAAAEPSKRECIEKFIDCINGKDSLNNKKIVYSAYATIFKGPPYDFSHQVFNKLKEKIEWLFSK